jgi:nicotinic acid mononucleotide adenylyltransferase
MQRRIAVYGGSFNPFGKHHQDIIRWLIEEGGFNTVLVVPSAAHALKGDLPDFLHRYNMAKLGVNDLCWNGMPTLPHASSVQVLSTEQDMLRTQGPPIYTLDLLREIQKGHGASFSKDEEPAEIKFAIGPDIRDEFDKWKGVPEIEKQFGFVDVPVFSMRATDLRNMIAEGTDLWKRHVPHGVAGYIKRNNLYAKAA